MARTSKAEIAERMVTTNPKLIVINSSTSVGRYHQMMRIRPTLLARFQGLCVGPFYLLAEHAIEKLCDELEALPEGTLRSLNAFHMDPTPADKELMDNVPSRRKRVERGPRKGATADALRASKKGGGDDGLHHKDPGTKN